MVTPKQLNETANSVCALLQQTASAAEGFVNFFKKNNRAIIIGETTKGARHPAKEIVINPLFIVSVPFLRGDETGVTEGEGIIPDIHVRASKSLETAIKHARKILDD